MFTKFLKATTVALAASVVSAQTYTDCDPTKRTDCPSRKAVGAKPVEVDFRQGKNKFFKEADGTKLTYDKDLGAVFSISNEKQAPTVGSDQYIFFGQVDVTLRAARGAGIVTSFVLQSDDLDEIDWEWLGGDNAQVQHNYFSKGCTETYDRGGFSPVADPIGSFHTYTIKWTPEQLDWIIDGQVVRTLKNTGIEGCAGYPQSPMQIKLGTWVAGRKDAPQGTIEWAGGIANFADAPFDGYYQSLRIVDYMGGQKAATEYQYGDKSGKWQSIKVIGGDGVVSSSSSSVTSKASTKTTSATTLQTVTSSTTLGASNSTSTVPTTTTTGTTEEATETETSTAIPTGAAGKVALTMGNMAAMGAAAALGYLVL
ncbi:concanavalin A-like lectin/glucanase domain-containing protein [Apiosordaria backusii]|uniref:Crh-like protein n=1 Tax=Apiosordaria backusii TaxID=314023 RepID=A0AA40K1P0_9PEZI|nr:concanavalin A-like lectin/glucanase domain-containing protein [Apiosordaria backusii]